MSKYYICYVEGKIASVIKLANKVGFNSRSIDGDAVKLQLKLAATENINKLIHLKFQNLKQLGEQRLTIQNGTSVERATIAWLSDKFFGVFSLTSIPKYKKSQKYSCSSSLLVKDNNNFQCLKIFHCQACSVIVNNSVTFYPLTEKMKLLVILPEWRKSKICTVRFLINALDCCGALQTEYKKSSLYKCMWSRIFSI